MTTTRTQIRNKNKNNNMHNPGPIIMPHPPTRPPTHPGGPQTNTHDPFQYFFFITKKIEGWRGQTWNYQITPLFLMREIERDLRSCRASRPWRRDWLWRSALFPSLWNRRCSRGAPGTCGSRRTSFRTCTWTPWAPRASCTSSTCSPPPPPP